MLCLAFSSVFHCFLCYSCHGTYCLLALSSRPFSLSNVLHQTLTLICSICISCQARLCRNRSAHLWQRCASYLLWILLHVRISIGAFGLVTCCMTLLRRKHLQTIYLTFSTLSCLITIDVSMQDRFSTFQYRSFLTLPPVHYLSSRARFSCCTILGPLTFRLLLQRSPSRHFHRERYERPVTRRSYASYWA